MAQAIVKETNNAGSSWPSGLVSLTNCPDGSYPLTLAQAGANYSWTWGTTSSPSAAWPAGQVTITDPAQGTLVFQPDATPPSVVGADTVSAVTEDNAPNPNTTEFNADVSTEIAAQFSVSKSEQTVAEVLETAAVSTNENPVIAVAEAAAAGTMSAADVNTLMTAFGNTLPNVNSQQVYAAAQIAVSVANSTAGQPMALNSSRFTQMLSAARQISNTLNIPLRRAVDMCIAAAKLTGSDADVLLNNLG